MLTNADPPRDRLTDLTGSDDDNDFAHGSSFRERLTGRAQRPARAARCGG